ncbi:unnamed protein product, partial [marine sediment metagenome]
MWPTPGSGRTDCRFRFTQTRQFLPTAIRWLVKYDWRGSAIPPDEPDKKQAGSIDVSATSPDLLEGSLPFNAEGFNLTVRFESMDLLPLTQQPGVEVTMGSLHAQFGQFTQVEEYPDAGASFWKPEMNSILQPAARTTKDSPASWPWVLN